MNIYALEGYKVRVTKESAENGDSHDKQMVKENLEIGKIYTVQKTSVHNWNTEVYLKEVPGKFNSVMFEDVHGQSDEADKCHPDWDRYNS